jgi:hypothetical protein
MALRTHFNISLVRIAEWIIHPQCKVITSIVTALCLWLFWPLEGSCQWRRRWPFLIFDFILIFFTLLLVGRRRLGHGSGAPVGKVGSMSSSLIWVRDSKITENFNLLWASGSAVILMHRLVWIWGLLL